jgi:hypothetical protein
VRARARICATTRVRPTCIGSIGTALRLVTVTGSPCAKQNAYTAAAASRSNSLLTEVSGAQPATAVVQRTRPAWIATVCT